MTATEHEPCDLDMPHVDGVTHHFTTVNGVRIHYAEAGPATRWCCCTAGRSTGGRGGT